MNRYAWQIRTNFRFGGAESDWGYQNNWFQDNGVPMAFNNLLCEFYDTPEEAWVGAERFIEEHYDDIEFPWDDDTSSDHIGPQTLEVRIVLVNTVDYEKRIYIKGERRKDLEDNRLAKAVLFGNASEGEEPNSEG